MSPPNHPASLVKNESDTLSINKAISKAFSVLYVYDYLLTFGDEVSFRASRPFIIRVHECPIGQVCVEGTENMVFVGGFRPKVH